MHYIRQVNWKKPETLVRLGIIIVVISAVVAALLLRNNFGASEVGYGAVALSALATRALRATAP